MNKIKCYVCQGVFGVEQKYRDYEISVLKRNGDWTKRKAKRGLHCPYCGNCLLKMPRMAKPPPALREK